MRQRGFVEIIVIIGILVLVAIGGAYYFGTQKNNINSTSSPFPVSQASPTTVDETANPDSIGANWKTYINQKSKFSLKYPLNWSIIKQTDETVSLAPADKLNEYSYGVIEVSINPKTGIEKGSSNLSLEEYIKKFAVEEIQGLDKVASMKKITNEKTVGYKVVWNLVEGSPAQSKTLTIAYFERFADPEHIARFGWIIQEKAEYENIYNEMISTFKFTP
ncbi:MAG: hypothetical protein G01um10145_965 [Microgenomates group bacterium Gr01-1014_5]|nr:MAG: hypothetical protein G01um10145_965 [Microgenomates group bacterium Gr01-1014_5]